MCVVRERVCSVSCEQVFYGSFEHVVAEPLAHYGPLVEFLELNGTQSQVGGGR